MMVIFMTLVMETSGVMLLISMMTMMLTMLVLALMMLVVAVGMSVVIRASTNHES